MWIVISNDLCLNNICVNEGLSVSTHTEWSGSGACHVYASFVYSKYKQWETCVCLCVLRVEGFKHLPVFDPSVEFLGSFTHISAP